MKNIDWSAPNILFAVLAGIFLLIFASSKKRFTFTYLLSTVLGAAGFLLSGWVGVLTLTMALCYRVFQSLKAPWQGIITVAAGLSAFAGATWIIHRLDPASAKPQPSKHTDGILGAVKTGTDFAATNGFLLILLLVGGFAGAIYVYWYMRRKAKNPYLGEGRQVPTDQMYRGVTNPNLSVLPENQRDPKRTFTAKMREDMLKDQHGLCRFQATISVHPSWEPYRAGIQWEGDHIIPHAVGGATTYSNLQVLCADCNSAKSSKISARADQAVTDMWKRKSD